MAIIYFNAEAENANVPVSGACGFYCIPAIWSDSFISATIRRGPKPCSRRIAALADFGSGGSDAHALAAKTSTEELIHCGGRLTRMGKFGLPVVWNDGGRSGTRTPDPFLVREVL
jgi:hypothetical protein